MSQTAQSANFLRVALLLLCCGCKLSLSSVPLADEGAATSGDAGQSNGGDSGQANGNGGPLPADSGAASEDAQAARVRHVSCEQDAPEILPNIAVARDPRGRPLFDVFRDYACSDLAVMSYPSCASYAAGSSYGCAECLTLATADLALCVDPREDAADCAMLTAREGSCRACMPPEGKAKACCAGLDVDCRAWPFEGSSGPGQLCAQHSDCQEGLLCKTTLFGGSGQCSCPEQDVVDDRQSCLTTRSMP